MIRRSIALALFLACSAPESADAPTGDASDESPGWRDVVAPPPSPEAKPPCAKRSIARVTTEAGTFVFDVALPCRRFDPRLDAPDPAP